MKKFMKSKVSKAFFLVFTLFLFAYLYGYYKSIGGQ